MNYCKGLKGMPSLYWRTDLGHQPALVVSGRFVSSVGELAAASGGNVFIMLPEDGEYLVHSVYDMMSEVRGLARVRAGDGPDLVAACASGGITVLGCADGALSLVSQSGPEQGAEFTGLACGDLDGDRSDEIVVLAPARGEIYIYRISDNREGSVALDLAGTMRSPGMPLFAGVIGGPGQAPEVLVAYEKGGLCGLARYQYTSGGVLYGGTVMEGGLPRITSLSPGNFTDGDGMEVAAGGPGGMVWIVRLTEKGEIRMVTRPLGTAVTVLAQPGPDSRGLMAGTPEGKVFVFDHPVGSSPDYELSAVEGVAALAGLPEGRLAVGTAPGGLQVWSLAETGEVKYIAGPGDTLAGISKRFNAPLEQLLSLNPNVMGGVLMPGQVLIIPALRD